MKKTKAQRILREFERAVANNEFRGSAHPDDRDRIHQRYLIIKERTLLALMDGDKRRAQ